MKKNERLPRRLGRNDPCHCGSGKKYKECCLKADQAKSQEQLEHEAGVELQRRLNAGPAGGAVRRYDQGFRLWAGLRGSDGKQVPDLPPQDYLGPLSPPKKPKKAR